MGRCAWLVISGLALLTGCVPSGGAFAECTEDRDCRSDQQCTRTRECVAGTLLEVRIFWTVNEQSVSPDAPGPCGSGAIDHLAVSFSARGEGELTYTPVPCSLGQIYYDKMPPRFDRVSLAAYGPGGEFLDASSAAVEAGENLVDLDLETP